MTLSSTPVVLIPGWLDTAGKMEAMAKHLKKQRFSSVIVSPQPSDGSAPIETLAVQALAEIDAQLGPDAAFDYVGFSMGGVIGRVILHWLGGKQRIRRFVTISTPHRGMYVARFIRQPALRQMQMGGPFIEALNRHLDDFTEIPFLSVWTPFDLTVVPPDSSVLPVGKSLKVLNPAHPLMVYDPRVQQAVADFLGRGSF
ncbi:MAG: alpha/beta fold hydrolase [Caldilinea sp.]|nr:alpha/beta fold hydrolase [Caldilinea sp.]MDW8442548.1 alpha/beta fold hydrolase [Caldilineaceae bacterium]